MTKSRWAATGLLALAFALGGLAGGVATMAADRDRPSAGGRAAYLAHMRREFLDQLRTELSLSADQEQAVVAVLDQHQPAMDSIWRSIRTQFDAERQSVRRDIRSLLSEEQRGKYDRFNFKRDSIRARGAGRDHAK